jgi:hypothetical protein
MDLKPKALFIGTDGKVYPDYLICSGEVPAELDGKPCPYSDCGRMPEVKQLTGEEETYSSDNGDVGDLAPPCAKHNLTHLGHWTQRYPQLSELRLFKCRYWFWLVVPGLKDSSPQQIED